MVKTIAQLHSAKPELRFCTGSSPACGMSEICDVRIADNDLGWKGLTSFVGQPFHKNNSSPSLPTKKATGCEILIVCTPSPPPPPSWVIGGEGWAIFQNMYIGGTYGQLWYWVGIGTLGGDDCFQVGLENSLYKK